MQLNENEDQWNIPMEYIIGSDGATGPSYNLQNYIHSPWSAGYFTHQLQGFNEDTAADPTWMGIDARWLQYIRVAYDIGENVVFDGAITTNDPNYYEYAYGGGANFGNWNDYRPWYNGSAIVGPDYAVNDNNWIDQTGYSQGWLPGTDGSPYLRNPAINDPRVASGNSYFSRAWNGDFTDWYYGTWNDGMFHYSDTGATGPLGLYTEKYWANPWTKLKTSSPDRTAAYAFDSWFKKSNVGETGYQNLLRGWYQGIFAPEGAGATGLVSTSHPGNWQDAYAVINIPQYFDAVVWRSFGQDAWRRSSGFQWRATPYWNNPGTPETPPADGVFNTFVIEIMLDKPLFMSGANWRFSGQDGSNSDLQDNEVYGEDGSGYLQKWSKNSSVIGASTVYERSIPSDNSDNSVYERLSNLS